MTAFSKSAHAIIHRMVTELSTNKYFYRPIAEGCYDACISNYGMTAPVEDKDLIVDKVLEVMQTLNETHKYRG